jgi:hypothetical protein
METFVLGIMCVDHSLMKMFEADMCGNAYHCLHSFVLFDFALYSLVPTSFEYVTFQQSIDQMLNTLLYILLNRR